MVGTLLIVEALKEGFIGILLTLDSIVYWLIAGAFKIFMAIAGARLLSSSAYTEIANKIYIIIGVVMLFVLSYALLRGIIDPDKETKGEFGTKMLSRIAVAVIGLAVTPFLFNFMYQLQGKILEDDIIGKLFFRIESKQKYDLSGSVQVGDSNLNYGNTQTNPDEYVKSIGGNITAVNLWQAFFFPSEASGKKPEEIEADAGEYFAASLGNAALCAGGLALGAAATSIPVIGWIAGPVLMIGTAVTACTNVVRDAGTGVDLLNQTGGKINLEQAYNMAAGTGDFSIFTAFIHNYVEDGEVTYLFIISTIAGGFALYAFVSFSIDMGVRAAMLAYLQIIAPIPLILQVLPKFKDNLSKYISKVLGTFMEVFVRISVVYVVVYIICHLTELFGSVGTWADSNGLNTIQQVLALALLILGLIAFCRKAPEIISETLNLPKGNMNLGIGKKLADGGFYSGRSVAVGGVKGAANAWNNVKPRKVNGKEMPITAGQKLGAALAGFGLGTANAVKSNFIGPDRKEAKTAKEAKAVSTKAAEAATTTLENMYGHRDTKDKYNEQAAKLNEIMEQARHDMEAAPVGSDAYKDARERYEKALKDYENAKAIALKNTMIGAAITDLEERAKTWAVGTVDTSKMDRKANFLAETRDLYDSKLKSTVANEDDVKAANRALAQAQNQSVEQYMYEQYRKTHPHSTDTFEKFASGIKEADRQAAVLEQNKHIKELEDISKNVTKRAVGRRMAEAAAGIENDTSRAVTKYVNDHRAEFEAFKYESIGEVYDEVLGQKVSMNVQDFMTQNFGTSGLERGVTDFANVAATSMINNSNLVVNYEDNNGDPVRVNLEIKKSNNGTIEYVLHDNTGPHPQTINIDANDEKAQETISRYIREKGCTKAKFVLTDNRTYDATHQVTFENTFQRYANELSEVDDPVVVNLANSGGGSEGAVKMTKVGNKVTLVHEDASGHTTATYTFTMNKNGKIDSVTSVDPATGTETATNEGDFNTAMQAIFNSTHVASSTTQRKKAPANMRMAEMKETAEREHDSFTFSPEYLDAQMRRRAQDAKKKNDQGK